MDSIRIVVVNRIADKMKGKIDPIAFRSAKVRKATANSNGTRRISTSINDNNIKLFVFVSDRNYPTSRSKGGNKLERVFLSNNKEKRRWYQLKVTSSITTPLGYLEV